MLQKIFPEDSPAISSESCVHAGWSSGTHIKDGYGVVEGSLSRETDLAVHQIWIPNIFIFGVIERINQQKKIPATISQMKVQVKEIIESIPAGILQRVIGEFSRRHRNCIVARGRLFEK